MASRYLPCIVLVESFMSLYYNFTYGFYNPRETIVHNDNMTEFYLYLSLF